MRKLLFLGTINAALLALLCLILLKKNSDNASGHRSIALPIKNAHITGQTTEEENLRATWENDLKTIAETPQTTDIQGQGITEPLPLEWEDPVIAVLNNSYSNNDERNKALIMMALHTARHVPRVQQECLMHLAFGLKDDDYQLFYNLSTDSAIPIGVRLKFIDQVFAIRPKELTKWLGQSLRMTSDPALISRAQIFLKEQKEMELFYSSQPEPPFQDAEPIPTR